MWPAWHSPGQPAMALCVDQVGCPEDALGLEDGGAAQPPSSVPHLCAHMGQPWGHHLLCFVSRTQMKPT